MLEGKGDALEHQNDEEQRLLVEFNQVVRVPSIRLGAVSVALPDRKHSVTDYLRALERWGFDEDARC